MLTSKTPAAALLRRIAALSGTAAALSLCATGSGTAAQTILDTAAVRRALAVPTARMVDAHVRFLADDLLRGRAPGTPGGDIAARYIRSQFQQIGLEPGMPNGAFLQPVRFVGVTPTASFVFGVAQRTTALRYLEDFVAWPMNPDPTVIADGDIVFVGYGIHAPEWNWDDYEFQPMTGKILLMLVNDPGLDDPSVFKGRQMTTYGDWDYKLEQAARLGAVGVILIHTDETAGYPWEVVRNSWSGERMQFVGGAPQTLRFAAWIKDEAARQIARAAGIDYELMVRRASRHDFRPITMNAHAIVDIANRTRRLESANVIGRLPAAGEAEGAGAILLTAHYDHLGTGRPQDGDSIYNGAQDNASGVAALLATAAGLAKVGNPTNRSVYFVATTAAESGLLGAEALARSPPVPLAQIAAVINIDVANLRGKTRDLVMLGADQSDLGQVAQAVAAADSLRLTSDPNPEAGAFYRSDHFPFARAGVPSLSLGIGQDFIDQAPDWGPSQAAAYLANRYHRPSDEYDPQFPYEGLLQQVAAMIRLAWALAESPEFPAWNEDAEFREAGRRLRAGR
jgi:Zn-dependent M28 family amino/carboxypeptidase